MPGQCAGGKIYEAGADQPGHPAGYRRTGWDHYRGSIGALGGVEISEQDNVSKVLTAVAEGSCEVGTTYYSDTYGYEDDLDILQTVSYDLTGDVIYPVARVVNEEADEAQTAAAEDFLEFILSDEAKAVFESYYFDTDV